MGRAPFEPALVKMGVYPFEGVWLHSLARSHATV